MDKFNEILKRTDFSSLIQFVMYGMSDEAEAGTDYEKSIENSLDKFFSTLESKFPYLNRNDPVLCDALSSFALIHDEAYFERGFIAGLKMYKNIEQKFSKIHLEKLLSADGETKNQN